MTDAGLLAALGEDLRQALDLADPKEVALRSALLRAQQRLSRVLAALPSSITPEAFAETMGAEVVRPVDLRDVRAELVRASAYQQRGEFNGVASCLISALNRLTHIVGRS